MPTSVLLAVLVAAGLLALAPALVRRYDATERLVAERAISTARVLSRRRRTRTVPGRRPVRPPSWADTPHLRLVDPDERPALRTRGPRQRPAVYRRRRVLISLLLLNLVEVAGVLLVGSGFWIPVGVTGSLTLLFLVHLRGQALRMARRRRAEVRQAAWLAERQAEVRLAQLRRAQARREAAWMLQEELQRVEVSAPPIVATFSYRAGGVRGRQYEVGPAA